MWHVTVSSQSLECPDRAHTVTFARTHVHRLSGLDEATYNYVVGDDTFLERRYEMITCPN